MSLDNQVTAPTDQPPNGGWWPSGVAASAASAFGSGQPAAPMLNGRPATAAPVPRPRRSESSWLTVAACVFGALGLAFGVMAVVVCLSVKSSSSAQISQLSRALDAARAKSASQISSINGQISSLNSQVSPLSGMGQYNMTCSTDLTGPNGPAQFDFPCTQHK